MKKKVSMPKSIAFIAIMVMMGVLMGAATKLDLATQASGILAKVNGGGGADLTNVTFPASGTLMTTATAVTASQLPNPSATTLGGVESISCSAGTHVDSISTAGVPHCQADALTLNQAAPTGTINGSNTAFSISPTPSAAADVECYQNGILLQQGAGNDYTISAANLTWLTAPPTGAKLLCTWF